MEEAQVCAAERLWFAVQSLTGHGKNHETIGPRKISVRKYVSFLCFPDPAISGET